MNLCVHSDSTKLNSATANALRSRKPYSYIKCEPTFASLVYSHGFTTASDVEMPLDTTKIKLSVSKANT